MTVPAHAGWHPPQVTQTSLNIWPFYLERQQCKLLRRLRRVWGDEAVIQIYAGWVRIIGEDGDYRYGSYGELEVATMLRRSGSLNNRAPCASDLKENGNEKNEAVVRGRTYGRNRSVVPNADGGASQSA